MIQKIRHNPKIFFALTFLLFIFFFLPQVSEAATAYTWVGPSGTPSNGNWTDATGWSPNGTPGSATGDSVTIDNGYTVTISAAPSNALASTTVGVAGTSSTLKMTATVWTYTSTNIDVNASGTIYVDEDNTQGNLVTISATTSVVGSGGKISADGTGFPIGQGPGVGPIYTGASYGGRGGNHSTAQSAATYGSDTAPVDLGSGSSGSAGGGAVRLNISGTLTNNGTITANGASAGNLGNGSGGSIYVTSDTITGNGTFTASGAVSNSGEGGGGGGRISLQATTADTFTGSVIAEGSSGSLSSYGELGTVRRNKYEDGSLSPNISTSVSWIGSSTFSFGSLTVENNATLTTNRYGGNFGASTNQANPSLILNITSSLTLGGAATGTILGNVNITVPTLTVNSGSKIDAYATGFPAAQGPGYKDTNSGGSYGGVGGNNNSTSTYGSATAPTDLGSGSGDKSGGGAIRLNVSGTLTNSGVINANGETSGGGSSDAGAGGSIYITAGTLTGSGTFTANGGGGTAGIYGGGGGRIALEVGANDSCPVSGTQVTVTGGQSYSTNPDGTDGTYRCGPLSATLTSNSFNTGDAAVDLSQISWDETVVGGSATSTVRIQLRTAPNSAGVPGTWTDWMGPTGTSTIYFETAQSAYCTKVSTTVTCSVPNNISIGDGASDQWIQYKVFLVSTDLSVNPTLSNVSFEYVPASAGGGSYTPSPSPIVSLSLDPSLIPYGSSSTLFWSYANVSSCLTPSGWSGPLSLPGSVSLIVIPTKTTNYSISCTGRGGYASQSVTLSVSDSSSHNTASFQGNTVSASTSSLPATMLEMQDLLRKLLRELRSLRIKLWRMENPQPFVRNLSFGSEGNDVLSLQLFLITYDSGPYAQRLSSLGANGHFGPNTQRALMEFQESAGIEPHAGYFGQKTRGYVGGL